MLAGVGTWASGEVLGFDFETTGVDRFNDVPVSYALMSVVDGVLVRSWSGLIDPGRDVPAEATAVHGISTERAREEGMPLSEAIALVADAVVAAGRRAVPLVGMKLDYDLTILETQAKLHCGNGLLERGWDGPVLDVVVIDRHFDPSRRGRRTLVDLCSHYGIEFGRAHDASADAVASVEVLFALASAARNTLGDRPRAPPPEPDPLEQGVGPGLRRMAALRGHDPNGSSRLRVAGRSGVDSRHRCLSNLRS